ncbi:hypothetical protein K505DRAFT_330455 [Melanomma pulvis-pyrius CBS 109.77]|uniref:Uncharacterized protein n=1 Tax=Melanomma pulvis-pyrius CBS 109.77 TaxID=1314802 RepID=A0A6A6WQU7_9PLEO|nr:hypothetical protein K505DRAFT_330455 [Melanomma pulvis-pyrius CBS 109.77]
MALRRQSLSPTANLLRNSRLFSLPNPLPRPNVSEVSGIGTQKANPSATLPYPTHQAIATTPKSLARGDWGLKRPLPARSYLVQTSNPVLRVLQLDTIEHITDFDSAADHVRTRQKWEELGIPMLKGMGAMSDVDPTSGTSLKSAFEKHADVTAYDGDEGLDETGMFLKVIQQNAIKNARSTESGSYTPFTPPQVEDSLRANRRWKHGGPWLPGMSDGDFMAFITKELSKRRKEFNKVLVEYAKSQIYTRRQAASSRQSTMPLDAEEAELMHAAREKEWSTITDEQIADSIRELRRETAHDPIRSKLVSKLIIPFLRLPPIQLKSTRFKDSSSPTATGYDHRFTPDTTPSSTHPSAGLGYLRTNAHLTNHPILGPQALPAPATARVVQPRRTASSKEVQARLGVAGFIANDDHRAVGMQSNYRKTDGTDVEYIDTDTPGGMKLSVQPEFGSVTPTGRVHIKLKRGYGPELLVARGLFEDQAPARDNEESAPDVLKSFAAKASGVKELDALGPESEKVLSFLQSMTAEKGGKAGVGNSPGGEAGER